MSLPPVDARLAEDVVSAGEVWLKKRHPDRDTRVAIEQAVAWLMTKIRIELRGWDR